MRIRSSRGASTTRKRNSRSGASSTRISTFSPCQMHAVTRTFTPSIRQLPRSQLTSRKQSKTPCASDTPTRVTKPSAGLAAGAQSPRSLIGNPSLRSIRHTGRRAFGSLVYPLSLHPVVTAAIMADAPHSPYMAAGELSPEELAHVFSELQDPHAEANRRHRLERLIMVSVPASHYRAGTEAPVCHDTSPSAPNSDTLGLRRGAETAGIASSEPA